MRVIYLSLLAMALVCCGQKEEAVDMPAASLMAAPPIIKVNHEEEMHISFNDDVQVMERKLIRNGRIEFRANDVETTRTELSKLCKSLNAYLSNETQRDDREVLSYSQTIRVPEMNFDELLTKIEKLAQRIDHRSVDTEDVTEEYIDIESRLKAKRELEKRYLDLLTKAKKVDDLLQIETEMSKVRSDIESMQGRLNYMRNRVAYSTLDVSYYKDKIISTEFGFGSRFINSLVSGWNDIKIFLLRFIAIWPIWLAGMTMIIVAMKYWKSRNKRLSV